MGKVELKPIVESFNVEEEFLYNKPYLFIKGYAVAKNMKYTLKALPLARSVHNGQYRKGSTKVGNKVYQLPYVLHVLKVASTLISLNLPISNEDLDELITVALLHDAIEDGKEFFKNDGLEIMTEYGFSQRVYNAIKLLSKHPGATDIELNTYFNEIKKDWIATLVKLADRSHNVESMYVMKVEKLHKYVKETRDNIYPLCTYAKANYPELSNGVTILKAKIVSLTELTETLVDMYEEKIAEMQQVQEKVTEKLQEIESDDISTEL